MKNMFLALALAGLTYVPSVSTADVDMDSDVELTEELGSAEEVEMTLMSHHEEANKNHRRGGRAAGARRAGAKACKEANITEAQKKQIKATMEAAKAAKAPHREAMKAAHVEFMTLLKANTTTTAQAETASAKMLNLKGAVAQIDSAAKLEILFKTLQPEQRIPAIKCHHAMKAKHHGRRGARGARGHGAGHGRGHGAGHGSRQGAGHGARS